MIAARKEFCLICKCEHIVNEHINTDCEDCKKLGWTCACCEMMPKQNKNIGLQFIYDKILRYEKLGFTSEYIHVAVKEYLKEYLK